MASEEGQAQVIVSCDNQASADWSFAPAEPQDTKCILASDAGMSNVERLLMDLQNKFNRQDEKLDNIQKSFIGLEDRVCNRLDQEKEYMRDRLSDAMKLILVRLSGGNPEVGDETSQEPKTVTKEEIQNLKERSDYMDNPGSEGIRDFRSLLQTQSQSLVTDISARLSTGFDSLREETVQTLEKEKQELLTEKDFFREQLFKALADVLVYVQEIKTCVKQDGDDVILNFDLDKPVITLEDVKNAVDTSKNETVQEMVNMKDALIQVLESNKESQTLDIFAKIENSGLHSINEVNSAVEKTENNLKQEITTSGKRILDKVFSGFQNAKDAVQETEDNLKQEITNLEVSSINTSKRLSKEITTDLKNKCDEIVKGVKKVESAVKTETTRLETSLKNVITKSHQTTNTELGQQRKNIVRDVHIDTDKRMQAVYRDLYDVIEKECQLTREFSRWSGGIRHQGVNNFYFRLTEFQDRVGTDLKAYSCPWHIPQFDTCLKGFARFETDGNLSLWLINGRNPKVVGLTPKSRKTFQYRVVITDNDQGKEKVVKEQTSCVLDEKAQKPQLLGYKIASMSCETLKNEGFIINDMLIIKYIITVPS